MVSLDSLQKRTEAHRRLQRRNTAPFAQAKHRRRTERRVSNGNCAAGLQRQDLRMTCNEVEVLNSVEEMLARANVLVQHLRAGEVSAYDRAWSEAIQASSDAPTLPRGVTRSTQRAGGSRGRLLN